MSDIQDRTLWMIEHNLVPTGVHLECVKEVFKKAKALDILKKRLPEIQYWDFYTSYKEDFTEKYYCMVVEVKDSYETILLKEEEYNLLKEVMDEVFKWEIDV